MNNTKGYVLMIPLWLQAGFWGLDGGPVLPGAVVGYFLKIPQRAIATQIMLVAFFILPLQAVAQPTQPSEADQDNIYHEDENLPNDADIFPRMGHTAGTEQENNNCRASAWGEIITTVPGNAFLEIDDRSVDRAGESWFHLTNLNCWIHESRIDLL